MKKLIVILLFTSLIHIFGQGFEWQYSSRMPFSLPKLYSGINLSYYSASNVSSLNYFEGKIPCNCFKEGTGANYSIGISSDYWFSARTAFLIDFSFIKNSNYFEAPNSLPRVGYTLETRYEFSSVRNLLSFGLGAKNRFMNTHFYYGASLNFDYLIANNYEVLERVISPDSFWFKTNPPSKTISYSNGVLPVLTNLIFRPKIFIGYDFAIFQGIYLSAKISSAIPIMNLAQDAEWKQWLYGFELTMYKSVK